MLDTVIIGAGIAGLAAGQFLIENGQTNFVVLEYDEKIGGRLRTKEFQGKLFSIGPGWVHGREGNPIYDIVQKLGIEIVECMRDEVSFVWDVNNNKDITQLFEEKSCEFENVFQRVCEKVSDIKIEPELSVADVFRAHSEDSFKLNGVDKFVTLATKEIFMGAPMEDVSGRVDYQLDKIYETEDEERNFRILDPLGPLKIINYLSETFPTKVELNCRVEKIFWDSESHSAKVVAKDGREFKCKHVIVTLQCDMLANDAIKFVPEIPAEKMTTWKHISAVNYCRIFAKFPRKFWPDQDWLISVIDGADPFEELVFWQNCSKQNLCSDDDYILICHYTSGYKKGSSRFDVDKESLMDMVTYSMKNMFPLTYCRPDDVLFVTHWNQGRFSGAFSVAKPGLDDTMIEMLGKSIGPLHFAGESVSVELMGTMQAAYVTGRKAAKSTFD